MPKLTQSEAIRLYKNKEMVINTGRGTLLTATPWYYDQANWDATFTQDFADVNAALKAIGDPASYTANTFYTKGSYDTGGVASIMDKGYDPAVSPNTLYWQADTSILGMGIGNFSGDVGAGSRCSHLESMRQIPGTSVHDVEDGVTSISEGFEQCYGMWELKAKLPPSFRSDCMIAWPSFWLYSNKFDSPDRPPLELDVFEIYQSSQDNVVRGDGSYHESMHTHDCPKSIQAPGFIDRDYNTSNIMGMNPNATFGAASDFDWGDAYHLFQILIGPRWFGVFIDGIEMTRHPTLDAYHQNLYMLVSHWINNTVAEAGAKIGTTVNGYIYDTIVWMYVDWVKCWQNPDWDDLTIGGTADVKTVTPGLTWSSYASRDGQCLNGTAASSNLTTTPTLNVGGLGAKVIKKHSDWANNGPWTGSLIALDIGDITTTGRHNYEWSNANNCFILLNPANPFVGKPKCYVPPAYTVDPITVDVEAVEGTIMAQWNKLALLPDSHAGKDQAVDPTLLQPRVVPNRSYTTVVTKVAGDLVGTCPIANTPSVPARATWAGSSNYRVDPANGTIYIASGAVLVEGTDTGTVSFWSPGVPQKAGANVCNVTINVQPNVPFDIAGFFGANLAAAYELDITAHVTLDVNKITSLADSGGYSNTASQANATKQPIYDATALNGFPCINNASTAARLDIANPVITVVNGFTGFNAFSDGSFGVTLNNTVRHCDPLDFSVPVCVYFEWNSLEVFCWVNGSPVGVTQQSGTITSTGWAYYVGSISASGASVYAANESDACLLQSISGAGNYQGKLGIFAVGKAANTSIGRDKLIASGMWRYGLQSKLPIGHPYRNSAPTLYG